MDNRHSGKYISNIIHDAGQVQQLVSVGVLNLMKDSFTLCALVGVMVYQNWKLSIFALFMMPLAAAVAKSLGKRIGKATGEASELAGKLTTLLSELLRGSRMIRIYQKEGDETKKGDFAIDEVVNKNIKIASIMIIKIRSLCCCTSQCTSNITSNCTSNCNTRTCNC